jgi:hypothetical protein
MDSTKRNARVAGVLYVLLGIVAPFRLMYIPGALIVRGDPTATAGKIAAHETLFRLGIVSDVCAGVIVIFVTLALYRLFRAVDQSLAVMMVILGGVLPAAIYFFNVLTDAAALMLVRGDFLAAFDKPQRDALAMLFLRLHYQVIVAAQTLWGLWLFPLAVLTLRSAFLPRFLGYWLIANGVAYLVMSFTGLLLPQHADRVASVAFPALLGEVAFMLWLLIRGAKEPPQAAAVG